MTRPREVLAVGVLPSGETTAPHSLLDPQRLKPVMEALPFEAPDRVHVVPLLDGWQRVYLTLVEPDALSLMNAAGRLAREMIGSAVDTLHLADGEDQAHRFYQPVLLGYLLGSNQPSFEIDLTHPTTETIAEEVRWARQVTNLPPNQKTPTELVRLTAQHLVPGLEVSVLGPAELAERRCGGILGVASGSAQPAQLVEVAYRPPAPTFSMTLVGKGVTFDSGGLSIKDAASMYRMKDDMSGAAVVFGAINAIARLEIPVSVTAIVPIVENMVGGESLRPGDVLEIRNGSTVEVASTDAEGRLILADALSLAAETPNQLIVDVASLTSAAETALGPNHAAVFSNSSHFAELLIQAGAEVGESLWPMPLDQDLIPTSDVADFKNANPGSPGGAISAAAFLEKFVDGQPWIHIDLGGTIWRDRPIAYTPAGATGFGVRSLVELARCIG